MAFIEDFEIIGEEAEALLGAQLMSNTGLAEETTINYIRNAQKMLEELELLPSQFYQDSDDSFNITLKPEIKQEIEHDGTFFYSSLYFINVPWVYESKKMGDERLQADKTGFSLADFFIKTFGDYGAKDNFDGMNQNYLDAYNHYWQNINKEFVKINETLKLIFNINQVLYLYVTGHIDELPQNMEKYIINFFPPPDLGTQHRTDGQKWYTEPVGHNFLIDYFGVDNKDNRLRCQLEPHSIYPKELVFSHWNNLDVNKMEPADIETQRSLFLSNFPIDEWRDINAFRKSFKSMFNHWTNPPENKRQEYDAILLEPEEFELRYFPMDFKSPIPYNSAPKIDKIQWLKDNGFTVNATDNTFRFKFIDRNIDNFNWRQDKPLKSDSIETKLKYLNEHPDEYIYIDQEMWPPHAPAWEKHFKWTYSPIGSGKTLLVEDFGLEQPEIFLNNPYANPEPQNIPKQQPRPNNIMADLDPMPEEEIVLEKNDKPIAIQEKVNYEEYIDEMIDEKTINRSALPVILLGLGIVIALSFN